MRKFALAAAVAATALLAGHASAEAKERYTYLHHATPTNVFWQAVKKGMDEACAQVDADCQMVFLQQDGNFQEQLNNLEADHRAEARRHHHDLRRRRDLRRGAGPRGCRRHPGAGQQRRPSEEDPPAVLHRPGPRAGGLRPRRRPRAAVPEGRADPRADRHLRPGPGLGREPRRRHRPLHGRLQEGQPRPRYHLREDR